MKIIKNNNNSKLKTLKEVSTNITSGRRLPKGINYSNEISDFLYFKVGDIKDIPNYNKLSFIDENTYNLLKKYEINENDLIISNIGTVGKVVFFEKSIFNYDKKMILTENCLKVTTNKNIIDDKYLMFSLRSKKVQKEIDENTIKTAMPKLSINRAINIKLHVPILEMQRKITTLLDYENKRIETLRNIIEKIEIRNQYYADKLLSGELTIENNIITISNNSQKNETIKITDHLDIINGYPFKSNEMKNEGKYAVIKMSNFKEKKVSTLKNTVYTNTLINKVQLMKNDLLIGLSGSVGEFAIFNLNEICLLNQRCIILRNKNNDIGDYVKTYVINKVLEDLKNSSEGGVIKNVSSNFFQDMQIILPFKHKEIMLFINKINDEKENFEKILKLEEQRFEWLSDKLLSGEYIIED